MHLYWDIHIHPIAISLYTQLWTSVGGMCLQRCTFCCSGISVKGRSVGNIEGLMWCDCRSRENNLAVRYEHPLVLYGDHDGSGYGAWLACTPGRYRRVQLPNEGDSIGYIVVETVCLHFWLPPCGWLGLPVLDASCGTPSWRLQYIHTAPCHSSLCFLKHGPHTIQPATPTG